jgi:AAA domain
VKIIRASETIAVAHPVFMIFGQPGIGKSSLGYSAADPLLLDFDAGAHRAANRRDTLQIGTWADVAELMAQPDALAPYQTIVVDTVGRCLDLMSTDIIAGNPKLGRDGNLSLQGYGALKARFRLWVAQLRTFGKDVVLIAHDKEEGDADSKSVRPDITGVSYSEVMKVSDFVGYLAMSGKTRVLDFNPTDKWVGKNPAAWAPLPLPPVAKAQTVLADLIVKGRAALGAISDASATVATQVDEWRAGIAAFTTVEECNAAIPVIKKLPLVVAPQVSKILIDHALTRGIAFDKATKLFVAPQPAGTAA